MNDKEQVIKHLEIIQGVINRLANNSSLIKGWSMTMLVAATAFISNNQQEPQYILLCFLIPVLGFWILDSYYLWQERIFREIYNGIRKKEKTDFKMNVNDQRNKPKCKWYNAFFSVTLITFYIIEAVFIVSAFLIFERGIL